MFYLQRLQAKQKQPYFQHLFGISWFLAWIGVSTLQMSLLEITWTTYKSATLITGVMAMWLLGSFLGQGSFLEQKIRIACHMQMWIAGLSGTLLSFMPAFLWKETQEISGGAALAFIKAIVVLLLALFLGVTSAKWLSHQHKIHTSLQYIHPILSQGKILAMARIGLALSWLLPLTYSPFVIILCLLPLQILNALFLTEDKESKIPDSQLPPKRSHARLSSRTGWRWYMSHAPGTHSHLVLLSISATTIISVLWAAILTPGAAHLVILHKGVTLIWLLGGQIIAWILFSLITSSFLKERAVMDKLVSSPRPKQLYIWHVGALGAMALMGGGLIAQTLPPAQYPWWWAIFVGCYSLGLGFWLYLVPLLKKVILDLHSQHAQTVHEHVHTQGPLAELTIILALLPVAGWLTDHFGTASMLNIAGVLLLLCVLGGLPFIHWNIRINISGAKKNATTTWSLSSPEQIDEGDGFMPALYHRSTLPINTAYNKKIDAGLEYNTIYDKMRKNHKKHTRIFYVEQSNEKQNVFNTLVQYDHKNGMTTMLNGQPMKAFQPSKDFHDFRWLKCERNPSIIFVISNGILSRYALVHDFPFHAPFETFVESTVAKTSSPSSSFHSGPNLPSLPDSPSKSLHIVPLVIRNNYIQRPFTPTTLIRIPNRNFPFNTPMHSKTLLSEPALRALLNASKYQSIPSAPSSTPPGPLAEPAQNSSAMRDLLAAPVQERSSASPSPRLAVAPPQKSHLKQPSHLLVLAIVVICAIVSASLLCFPN